MGLEERHRRCRTVGGVLLALMFAFLVACSDPRSHVPPDPPATPLTAEQHSQYPLPGAYLPGRDGVRVYRSTTDNPPDAPGPKRPRYSERRTSYSTVAGLEAILGFYRQTLPEQGWQFCRSDPSVANVVDWYCPASGDCLSTSLAILRVNIYQGNEGPYEVTIVESLPALLEWPER
jgi:hypothetical protein